MLAFAQQQKPHWGFHCSAALRKRELLRTRHFQQLARKNNENFGKKERGLDGVSPLDKEKHKALYYNKAIRT